MSSEVVVSKSVRVSAVWILVCAMLAVPGAARADTTVTTCTDAALRSAVAGGGIVTFGTSCSGLQLVAALAVPAGHSVDLRSGGFSVVLDGRGANRHFEVTGGALAISGITLTNGRAAGTSGAAGSSAGSGPDGDTGASDPDAVTSESALDDVSRHGAGKGSRWPALLLVLALLAVVAFAVWWSLVR